MYYIGITNRIEVKNRLPFLYHYKRRIFRNNIKQNM